MMITPIIFCTIVLGIGSVRKAAEVGKVGGLALGYFITMSTVALAIGLVVGNIIKPGDSLNLTAAIAESGQSQIGAESEGTVDFILGHHPRHARLRAHRRARCSRPCSSRCSSASRCSRWARPATRSSHAIKYLERLVFKVMSMIMWAAPVGAFGAMAAIVGATGATARSRAWACSCSASTSTCAIFVFGILGTHPQGRHRGQRLPPLPLPRPRVPPHPVDVVLGVGPAAADRQDGAPRRLAPGRRHHRADRLLLQPRRHGDLPHDGARSSSPRRWTSRSASASRSRCCSS